MQFESRLKRAYTTNIWLGLIPDALIAVGVGYWTQNWLYGLYAWLAIQGLYLVFWAKYWIWSWFVYWVSGRRRLTRHLENYLVEYEYPAPAKFLSSTAEYLAGIANDEKNPCKLRVLAAIELATLQSFTKSTFQRVMQINMAYEDALERHRKYCRAHGKIPIEGD